MQEIYTKPLRVYILLAALAAWGIFSGLNLPISLFPKSSQVNISVRVPYGSLSSQQFFETYGQDLESSLNSVKVSGVGVYELSAEYRLSSANYNLKFNWGAEGEQALKEVDTLVKNRFSNVDDSVRRGINIYQSHNNQGFFAVSFYSPMRSLDEIYDILNPIITPFSSQIQDAENVGLFNPNKKEITITLIPEKLAQFEVTTLAIQNAIQSSTFGLNGGTLKIGDKEYLLDIPKSIANSNALGEVRINQDKKKPVYLKDVARINVALSEESRQKFKTSGVDSLILFSSPKEGGNIKNMSDQLIEALKKAQTQWPEDIKYKILVNPSEFINESIHGVVREVFVAALLAVIILFIFIGNFKNVITAAIEIPLSLLLAFILMRLVGMNLNLISLGGLALSAGMNVDASVVVLENIFRHFEGKNPKASYTEKVQTLLQAVAEVRNPIIASTIASLVVFAPLIFTNGLTNSLLGDLAKAVIFSHGLSAVVALILVPTIRLQLISQGLLKESHSPFEKFLGHIESAYSKSLLWFLKSTKSQILVYSLVILALPLLVYTVIPKLNKEIIGRPDTDWLIVGAYSSSFNTSKEVEAELEMMEQTLIQKFPNEFSYTFTQIYGDQNGNIMFRLKDKKKIEKMASLTEEIFKNTPTKSYWVEQWNPSELEIPDPPDVRIELTAGTPLSRHQAAQDLQDIVYSEGLYDKMRVTPSTQKPKSIFIRDSNSFGSPQEVLSKSEISHYLRVATDGVYVQKLAENQKDIPIYLRLEKNSVNSLELVKSLPIGFEGRLIPLGALAQFNIEERLPNIYRENQRSLVVMQGSLNKKNKDQSSTKRIEFKKRLIEFENKLKGQASNKENPIPQISDVVPDKELQEALNQLKLAIGISIFLIFLTMVLQLGDLVQSLLVLVAIPLGFIGTLASLYVFKSTLSLNSGLGTILLNGIAVANSIILVDFIQKLFSSGLPALESTLKASTARLRPILMTSLTTVLGMLPIALGLGEGGKILQPLGIAVCGGLWVSMSLTLFVVPALQFQYLNYKSEKEKNKFPAQFAKSNLPEIYP